MKTLLLFCCAFLCCGFTVITPEMVRKHEKLCALIRRQYGEAKLTAFVQEVVAEHPTVDGAKLADSKVGKQWVSAETGSEWHLISEDWAFRVRAERAGAVGFARFTMFWKCDENHGVFLEGHRAKSGELVFDSLDRVEVVEMNWR